MEDPKWETGVVAILAFIILVVGCLGFLVVRYC